MSNWVLVLITIASVFIGSIAVIGLLWLFDIRWWETDDGGEDTRL